MNLIIPTLDVVEANRVGRVAAERAGLNVNLIVVHDQEHNGFTATVNRGLRQAQGHVCLLNDDAEPETEGWLTLLLEQMEARQRVGFVGPSGACRTAPQNTGRRGDKRRPKVVSHLAGFCLLVNREMIDEVGLLDERFRHYGSDVDWQGRAVGWRSIWVPGVFCVHRLSEAIQPWWDLDNETFYDSRGRHLYAQHNARWPVGADRHALLSR